MGRPLIDRSSYDHPEHFDDLIREYRTSERYIPTHLEDLLYELSGHRCTICHAPWLEIHHIDELGEGGETKYENLIVLCPNCHTRVHKEGVPSKRELHHYKRKLEIAYELPILDRLDIKEWKLIQEVAKLPDRDHVVFSRKIEAVRFDVLEDSAIQYAWLCAGCSYLQETGMVSLDVGAVSMIREPNHRVITLHLRLTPKGVKWIRYLRDCDRIQSPKEAT
jgi:hypothetical protein